MLRMTAYADQIAAGDTGAWQAAVSRAAAWISPHRPDVDLTRQLPLAQGLLKATALLVYGLAAGSGIDPRAVSAPQVLGWITERQLPTPPLEPPRSREDQEWIEAFRHWRRDLDAMVARQLSDLAALLRTAGHQIPAPGFHSLTRTSPDPVAATWLALADTDSRTP
ncbi:hypothetical protein [Paractinoplanes durhamensis]|nr:hypothetical protein [Actinoplanes durhamensis]